MDTSIAPRRLTIRDQLTLSFLWLALNVPSAALLPVVVPVQIWLFIGSGHVGDTQQATFLGWLSALGAIVSLFVPPVIGHLSDRTSSALGRRRPYILAGALAALISVPLLIIVHGLVIFALGLALLQIGFNAITAGYQGLTPDLVPQEQRGAASGFMGLMTILGNAISLWLAAELFREINPGKTDSGIIHQGITLYYILTILVLLFGVLVTSIGIHETPHPPILAPSERQSGSHRSFIHIWLEPWHAFNFSVVFFTRFAVMTGLTLFMTFIEYYIAVVGHVPNFVQATVLLIVIALLGAILSAFFFGVFSDHVKRAPLVSVATTCMALAALAFVILPVGFPLAPLGLLFGLGYGAYTSVDWALSVDALPTLESAGKDLGLWSASVTLPAILAPLLGSLIINATQLFGPMVLGYRLIFAAATTFLLLAAVCVLFVKERKTPTAPQRSIPVGWRLAFQARAGRARGFLRFWPLWEQFTLSLWHVQPVPDAPNHLLSIRFIKYKGSPVDLPDGIRIQKGDPVIELHFHNHSFLWQHPQTDRETTPRMEAWKYMHTIAQGFQALAAWMQQPDFPGDARAIFGVTLLYRGAPRFGFTLRPRKAGIHAWFERFFMTGLLVLYHPQGSERLLQGTTYGTYPHEVWISWEDFLKRYGSVQPK